MAKIPPSYIPWHWPKIYSTWGKPLGPIMEWFHTFGAYLEPIWSLETLHPAIVVTRASYTLLPQQHTRLSNNSTPHNSKTIHHLHFTRLTYHILYSYIVHIFYVTILYAFRSLNINVMKTIISVSHLEPILGPFVGPIVLFWLFFGQCYPFLLLKRAIMPFYQMQWDRL